MVIQLWQLGVLASCSASFLGTLGMQLRILADSAMFDASGDSTRPRWLHGRAVWCLQLLGWTSWLVGQGFGQIAILFAPATIVACTAFSSSLLCNTLLAPFVLRERLTRAHGVGVVLLCVGGSMVTLIAGVIAPPNYSGADLLMLGLRAPFLVIAGACLTLALGMGVACAVRRKRLDVWSFAFLFALCGATDLLVTKCTLGLLSRLAAGENDGQQASSASLLTCCSSTMILLHLIVFVFQVASTRFGEALQNAPLFLGSGAMMQVALAGTFFNEFSTWGKGRDAVFMGGFGLMLTGLLVTSRAAAGLKAPQLPLIEPLLDSALPEDPDTIDREQDETSMLPGTCLQTGDRCVTNAGRLPPTPLSCNCTRDRDPSGKCVAWPHPNPHC